MLFSFGIRVPQMVPHQKLGQMHATIQQNIMQHCWIVSIDVVKGLTKHRVILNGIVNVYVSQVPVSSHPSCVLKHYFYP